MPLGQLDYRAACAVILLAPLVGCSSAIRNRAPWLSPPASESPQDSGGDHEAGGRVAVVRSSPFALASARLPSINEQSLLTEPERRSVSEFALLGEHDLDFPRPPSGSQRMVDHRPEESHTPAGQPNRLQSDLNPIAPDSSDADVVIDVLPQAVKIEQSIQTIDLASALGMAGANAWTIQLARQRTVEAHADLTAAKAMWLPSIQFGVGWNKHDGRLQETSGNVLESSRGSFFVGGGSTLGAPIAGGTNGPLRLSADLALADAYFAPKIQSRQLYARRAGVSVARNRALLDAGTAYIDLLEAAGRIADAQQALDAANELVELTKTFASAGAGAQADVDRAATEFTSLNQQLQDARRLLRSRSAMLARRLRLDPRFALQPADQFLVPLQLSPASSELESLIATAYASRPEMRELSQEIAGLCLAVRQADVEPWIPHLAVTTSSGNFRGGTGSGLDNNGGRSDIDLQALWQIENLGFGVKANRSRAGSRLAQRRTQLADLRDQTTAAVVQAYEDVISYRQQIDTTSDVLMLAESSFQRNVERIRADEGLPIELLQAIIAKANGLRARTEAVANYNRAQLRLLYETGQLQP